MGLAGAKTAWQRQTRHFGHDNGDKYTVLILDNRGIGLSDKPLARYTTSDMAQDVIELLDHVGWTEERSVNLVGISLGGMISQEVACAIPSRLQSLSLLCTTASFESNKRPLDSMLDSVNMVIPKTEERAVADTARKLFADEWLAAPDGDDLPSPKSTPRCGPSPSEAADSTAGSTAGDGDGEYLRFDSNFQRFQAQELMKRHTPGFFTRQGFLCQLMAAAGHRKSASQLREMADRVGRDRILIIHGTRDRMITVTNGEKLIKMIKPAIGLIVDGMGHAPIMDRSKWFNALLEERLTVCKKIDAKI